MVEAGGVFNPALRLRGFVSVCDCPLLCPLLFGLPGEDLFVLTCLSSCGLGDLNLVLDKMDLTEQLEIPGEWGEGVCLCFIKYV